MLLSLLPKRCREFPEGLRWRVNSVEVCLGPTLSLTRTYRSVLVATAQAGSSSVMEVDRAAVTAIVVVIRVSTYPCTSPCWEIPLPDGRRACLLTFFFFLPRSAEQQK